MRRSLVLCLGVLAALTASAGFYVDDDVWVDYQDGNDGFTVSGNEATIVWAPMGLSGKVTVPGTLEGGGQAYTVTSIEGAFYDCTRITEMILPESVRTIGEEAFVNCAAMTAITLPSGLAAIGDYAFEACAKLKAIELPAGVGDIAESAFCGCRDLTFSVAEGNGAYKSVNGGLFDKSVERLIRRAGGVAAFTVPETVTSLGAFAFDGLETLTLLHFQGGVPDYQGYPDYTFNATITQGTYPAAHAEEWKNVLQDGKWRVELTEDNDDEEDWEAWLVPHDIAMMPHGMWLLQSTNAKWLTIGGTETCVCQEAAGSGGFVSEGYILSKCSTSISGELEIPAEIDGIPVVHICFDAFKGCAGLTKVTIPGTIRTIPNGLFSGCAGLTAVTFAEGVQTLAAPVPGQASPRTFASCAKLKTVKVPSTMDAFGDHCFGDSPLVGFSVAPGNPIVSAVDGALLSADGSRLLVAPGGVASYATPGGVTCVGGHAFDGRTALKSVSLPASVSNVETPLLGATAAVSVDAANPVYAAQAGSLFDKDLSTLLYYGGGSQSVYTLPDTVSGVDRFAFNGAVSVQQVKVHAGVTRIDDAAFSGNVGAVDVDAANPNYVSTAEGAVMALPKEGQAGKRLIHLPYKLASYTIPDDVTAIGDYSLWGCQVANLTLPSVVSFGEAAFAGCANLATLTFKGRPADVLGLAPAEGWPERAVGRHPSLWTGAWAAVMEDGRWQGLRMEPYTISGVAGLLAYSDDSVEPVVTGFTSTPNGALEIPQGVAGIAPGALQNQATLTAVSVPGSVTTIGADTFGNNPRLATVSFGEGVSAIAEGAFRDCTALTKVAIPASCVSIASGAFGACGNVLFEVAAGNAAFKAVDGALLSADGTRLLAAPGNVADYAVPEGVQTIDDNAFAGRPRLTSVSLPASLRAVQPGAFLASAAKVSVDGANPTFWASDGGLLQRDVSVDGTVWETLLHVPTSATQYVVPDGVSVIGDHAFTDCSRLTAVTLPAAEERLEITATAFEGCGALRTVTFRGRPAEYLIIAVEAWPDNALGTYPRLWAALWQERLGVDGTLAGLPMRQAAETGAAASLQYGGTADAPIVAALAASASGALVIPYGVAAIEPGALADCRVSSVTVPGSEKTLGPDTFVRNASLATVTLERGVEAVQAGAFDTCNVLTKVVVPDTCTEIDPLAFEACPEIAFEVAAGNPSYASDASGALLSKDGRVLFVAPGNVSAYTIPVGVETIAAGAFAAGQSGGRVALGSVTVPATVTDIALGAFAGFGPVTVAEGNAAYASRSGALLSADGRVLYHVPNTLSGAYTVPEGVVEIAAQAFQGCAKLSALTVPATVDVVGSDALAGCADMAAKSIAFLGEPPTTVAEGAFAPCAAATYPKALWREWAAVITDGTWNGLAMTTTPFSITLKIVGAGSLTDSLGKKYTAASTVASYQPAQAVTLTATPGSGSVFLGWSGEGLAKDGASASFIADGDVTFTAHFVTQQVADSMEAVGVGGDGGASLEEALANGEVVRREDIPDLVKEMAFGAPVIEVGDETLVLEIGLQRAETLGDWEAMGLQTAETAVTPDGERLRLTIRKPEGSSAAFAALALGAAQSINISWSQTGDDIVYGSDLTIRPTDMGAAYSAAICFSINEGQATTDNQKLAHIAQWASGSTQVFLDENNSVRVQKFDGGGIRNESLTVTPGETNVLVLTFDYPAATNEAKPTITAYLNGQQLWTITSPNKAPGLSLNLTQNEAWTVSEVVAYEQVLSADQATWLYDNKTAVLPEPTALALLALGMAGVALRRRVA